MKAALIALVLCVAASAQEADASRAGDSVDITNWRFHKGDDPRWASPHLDDSAWQQITSKRSWKEQGIGAYSGWLWYRQRILLPADAGPLTLLLLNAKTSYEVFADGKLIGHFGEVGSFWNFYQVGVRTFPLPRFAHSRSLTLAIRFWQWPTWAEVVSGGVGSVRGAIIGPARVISEEALLDGFQIWSGRILTLIVAALMFLGAAGMLLLYQTQRAHAEYGWLGWYFIATGLSLCFFAWRETGALFLPASDAASLFLHCVGYAILVEFLLMFLNIRRGRLIRLYQMLLFVEFGLEPPVVLNWVGLGLTNVIQLLIDLPLALGAPIALAYAGLRANSEAKLLFWPMTAWSVAILANNTVWILFVTGIDVRTSLDFHIGPVPVTVEFVSFMIFLFGICAVLFRRFNTVTAERERAAAELEAARTVQALLIPDTPPLLPGVAITTAYIPAAEVGGDFFQILPADDGSVLIVIGDVSGKGLKAAMVVSTIVGALRNEFSRSPSEVLSHLNRTIAKQMDSGFVTCCAALLERDGAVEIANAGHLPPYLNGVEIPIGPSLPLGLNPDSEWSETLLVLAPGDKMAFVSDGIVEARNASGDLFGFERTSGMASGTATEIAAAARSFGQEDDITAITVTRQEAEAHVA